jgi:hypothetical protein
VLEARASANWPTTKGVITEAKLVETSRGPFQSFETKVGYTYKVDGQAFTGNRLKIGGKSSSDEATAQLDMKRYGKIDAFMDVHYNPADPGRSTLETGGSGTDLMMMAAVGPGILVFGLFLIAVGIFMSLLARKTPAEDGEESREADEDEVTAQKKKRRAEPKEDEEDRPRKKKTR